VKVLLDQMYDGYDLKLKESGYETYSVKKLISEGRKLESDYSVIKYADENGMVIVTNDTEMSDACKENKIPHVFLNDKTLSIMLEELAKLK